VNVLWLVEFWSKKDLFKLVTHLLAQWPGSCDQAVFVLLPQSC